MITFEPDRKIKKVKLIPMNSMPAAPPENHEGPEERYEWGNSFNRDWLNKVA